MKLIKVFSVFLLVVFLAACTSKGTVSDPSAAFKGQSAKHIYLTAESNLLAGNYDKAIKGFQALGILYPFNDYSQKAELDIIYAYYKADDVASTLAASDRYIHLYPMGPHIAYAYYMRGLSEFYEGRSFLSTYFPTNFSQRNLVNLRTAFLDFSRLVYRYPHSKYTPDARLRMIYIRNIIARHELEVAVFYYQRKAYVAAANRATQVVQHFQQSTSVPAALVIMTQAYHKLGSKVQAEMAYNVLVRNFPNNPNVKSLHKLLVKKS
jgi:outer membrane protein assembly factor BamD